MHSIAQGSLLYDGNPLQCRDEAIYSRIHIMRKGGLPSRPRVTEMIPIGVILITSLLPSGCYVRQTDCRGFIGHPIPVAVAKSCAFSRRATLKSIPSGFYLRANA